jgi:hypothetical protein
MEIVQRLDNTKAQTLKFFELTDEELDKSYEPGKWTVRYILHHLADAEWARKLDYANLPLELSGHIFASVREGIIHNVRLHYDSSSHLEFVHSETGVQTLKDEVDKVARPRQLHRSAVTGRLYASKQKYGGF